MYCSCSTCAGNASFPGRRKLRGKRFPFVSRSPFVQSRSAIHGMIANRRVVSFTGDLMGLISCFTITSVIFYREKYITELQEKIVLFKKSWKKKILHETGRAISWKTRFRRISSSRFSNERDKTSIGNSSIVVEDEKDEWQSIATCSSINRTSHSRDS